jgi:hypothetical protein
MATGINCGRPINAGQCQAAPGAMTPWFAGLTANLFPLFFVHLIAVLR